MKKILMSVPNISEGRVKEVVEQVAEAIRQTPGVKLINYSSDADHNRSVFTYLGEPNAVLAASEAMASKALKLIDMTQHQGSHPRIGAIDVVPFIPIQGMEVSEAIEISRQFGQFMGAQGVSVYYYEDSATHPDRQNLAKVRKGQYEGLAQKLQDPAWQPDAGPANFNAKSGATVTGARFPLIAFNVNLNTNKIEIADKIAKAVRHINGGYRHVKAMGVELKELGLVQVSMNLVNYTQTPIHRVVETIRFEAARYGVTIAGTELIGTIPLGAIEDIMKHYLQTHDFSLSQIIETALIE